MNDETFGSKIMCLYVSFRLRAYEVEKGVDAKFELQARLLAGEGVWMTTRHSETSTTRQQFIDRVANVAHTQVHKAVQDCVKKVEPSLAPKKASNAAALACMLQEEKIFEVVVCDYQMDREKEIRNLLTFPEVGIDQFHQTILVNKVECLYTVWELLSDVSSNWEANYQLASDEDLTEEEVEKVWEWKRSHKGFLEKGTNFHWDTWHHLLRESGAGKLLRTDLKRSNLEPLPSLGVLDVLVDLCLDYCDPPSRKVVLERLCQVAEKESQA